MALAYVYANGGHFERACVHEALQKLPRLQELARIFEYSPGQRPNGVFDPPKDHVISSYL